MAGGFENQVWEVKQLWYYPPPPRVWNCAKFGKLCTFLKILYSFSIIPLFYPFFRGGGGFYFINDLFVQMRRREQQLSPRGRERRSCSGNSNANQFKSKSEEIVFKNSPVHVTDQSTNKSTVYQDRFIFQSCWKLILLILKHTDIK